MNVLRSSELSLALLIGCSVKMTCLLGFAWIIASAARRRSAAFRHLVWSLGILCSLTLPLLTLLLPAWHSNALWNASGLLGLPHGISTSPSSQGLRSMIVDA